MSAAQLRDHKPPNWWSLAEWYATTVAELAENPAIPVEGAECARGCAWCCGMDFTVSIPELFAVVRAVGTLDPQVREQVCQRSRQSHLDQGPCPLLRDTLANGECVGYKVRPLACLAHSSQSQAACRDHWRNGDAAATKGRRINRREVLLYRDIFAQALKDAYHPRQPDELLNFRAALKIALGDPDALSRWCQGEDVFAAASCTKPTPEQCEELRAQLQGPGQAEGRSDGGS